MVTWILWRDRILILLIVRELHFASLTNWTVSTIIIQVPKGRYLSLSGASSQEFLLVWWNELSRVINYSLCCLFEKTKTGRSPARRRVLIGYAVSACKHILYGEVIRTTKLLKFATKSDFNACQLKMLVNVVSHVAAYVFQLLKSDFVASYCAFVARITFKKLYTFQLWKWAFLISQTIF